METFRHILRVLTGFSTQNAMLKFSRVSNLTRFRESFNFAKMAKINENAKFNLAKINPIKVYDDIFLSVISLIKVREKIFI